MKREELTSYPDYYGATERAFIETVVGPLGRSRSEQKDWDGVADRAAEFASTHDFSSRHGSHDLFGKWVYYNNNPFATTMRRASLIAAIAQEVEAAGAEVLGYGTSQDGYSIALVMSCGALSQLELDAVILRTIERAASSHVVA